MPRSFADMTYVENWRSRNPALTNSLTGGEVACCDTDNDRFWIGSSFMTEMEKWVETDPSLTFEQVVATVFSHETLHWILERLIPPFWIFTNGDFRFMDASLGLDKMVKKLGGHSVELQY